MLSITIDLQLRPYQSRRRGMIFYWLKMTSTRFIVLTEDHVKFFFGDKKAEFLQSFPVGNDGEWKILLKDMEKIQKIMSR
jgi:hypothetical protein